MADSFRYNVIVDVAINPQTNQGKTQVRGALNQIEQEAKRSYQNMQRDHARSIQEQKRQIDSLVAHHNRAADAIAAKARYHQERFKAMQLQAVGLNTPANIRQQTQAQSNQQRLVSQYSTGSLNDALRSINNLTGSKIQLGEVEKKINDVSNASRKGAGAFGMWGQAFKGAFIGAVAGITFSTIISGITGIGRAIAQAGIDAVKAAADFEQTTNALKVFTGSTRLAKTELAAVGEIVSNVPGLRLPDAEVGYQRLRALGFEAKTAGGFIKELGEEKILSGASDEAIERVIFNFAQLASGGQKVSQELREIVTQMPTLRKVFQDTFGTLNYGEIQKVLDRDPNAFFQRLIDTMAKGDAATGGFNSSITDLTNEWTKAGRAFGEPVLEPLAEDIKDLTMFLKDNMSTWASWGQSVGDALQGVSDVWRGLTSDESFAALFGIVGAKNTLRGTLALGTFGLSENIIGAYNSLESIGKLEREAREKALKPFADRFKGGELSKDFTIDFSKRNLGQTDREKEIERAESAAADQAYIIRENARKRELALLKESGQSRIAILKDQASVEMALVESTDAFTLEQIMKKNKRVSDIEQKHIQQEIARQSDYYNQVIALTTDTDEQAKLTLEKNEKISGLNTQLRISEIEEAKQTRDDLRQILRQRRDDAIEFLNLESRSIQQALDRRSFDIERSLELQTGDYNEHYRRLTEVTTDAYIEQSRVVREQLNLKLQDETLTDEQIVNLRTQTFLELQNLTEQNRQRTIQIEKRRLDQYVQETNRAVQQTERLFLSRSGQLGALGGLFSPESVASSRSGAAGNDFLKGIFEPITKIYEEGGKAINRLLEINELVGKLDTEKDAQELRDLSTEAKGLERVARSFQALGDKNLKAIPDAFEKIVVQSRELKTTADFDTLAKDVLTFQQSLESASLDKKIATINQQFDAGAISGKEFNEQIQDAFSDRTSLAIKQAAENAELYRNSLDGLRNTIKELSDPNSTPSLGLQRIIEGKSLQESISKITELRETQFRVANPEYDEYLNKMDIEIAKGQDIIDIRNRETDAIIRANRAKLELDQKLVFSQNEANARVLEFLAQQKGITDIVSDAKINLLTGAYSSLESVVGRLTQRFGVFGDAIKETITNLIKLALNPFLRRLFGGGAGGASAIPGIPGLGGGGFGGFGTPPFVSNFTGGGGGITGSSIIGWDGGQGGGGLLPGGLGQVSSGVVGGTQQASLGSLFSGQNLQALIASAGLSAIPALLQYAATTTSPLKGALTGGLFGLVAGFINRSKLRRQEETTRNQAMIDALRGLDNIIEGVRNDRIDGQSAIQQAEQIRATYVEQMSALKDKKTRRIALADVSRLDAKISQIKSEVNNQENRKARLELSVPTFAQGGSLSRFTGSNHLYNPQGYQAGGQKFGYFPNAGMTASFNERGSEYILDAETTRNVGVPELDKMRASRGKYIPAKYMGGLPGNSGGGSPIIVENHYNVSQNENGTITIEMVESIIKNHDGSETQTANFVNNLTKRGGQPLNTLARAIDSANKR